MISHKDRKEIMDTLEDKLNDKVIHEEWTGSRSGATRRYTAADGVTAEEIFAIFEPYLSMGGPNG